MAEYYESIYTGEKIDELLGWVEKNDDYALADLQNGITANKTGIAGVVSSLDGKVDKVDGKGLSSNDYTDAEKARLASAALVDSAGKIPASLLPDGIEAVVIADNVTAFPATGDEKHLYFSRSNATLYYWGEAGMYVPTAGGSGGGGDIPWERIVTGVSVEYRDDDTYQLCVVARYGDEEGTETLNPIPEASASGAGLMSVAQNNMLERLADKVFPLSIALTLSPNVSLLERGQDTIEDAVLSWKAYVDGREVTPDTMTVREQCPALGTDTTTETTEQGYTVAVLAATTTLTVTCKSDRKSVV